MCPDRGEGSHLHQESVAVVDGVPQLEGKHGVRLQLPETWSTKQDSPVTKHKTARSQAYHGHT